MAWVKTGADCPCGEHKGCFATDDKGNSFCFSGSCKKPFFRNEEAEEFDKDNIVLEAYPHRGLTTRTFNTYGVKTKIYEELPLETAFFYPNGSIKIRNFAEKKFRTNGDMTNAALFGSNVFDRGSKRVITITEGEYDALSVYQMLSTETAAVSIRSSSSAYADCRKEYEYINSFEKIVLSFDNDEPGQTAAKKVASLFDFKKVFNLVLTKHKDANKYLEEGDVDEYCKAWRGVKRYTPDSILSTMGEFRKALEERPGERLASYPFEILNGMLYGMHRGEVVVIKAPEGVGKSEFFRALENHVLKTTKHPIGLIHLEEDNGTTLRAMAGYFSEQPVLAPDAPMEDEEIVKILESIVGEDENRFVLHSSFDVEDETAFIDNVRFMVAACGAQVVFFDHISWLAANGVEGDDERKRLDRIAQKLKLLAQELGFCLIMISHVNDDGQTRGSRYISKVANTVISLFRDKTNPAERLKTMIMIEKARLIGAKEGPAGYALYDEEKLMLIDPMKQQLEFHE